jgi:hypothetical protein
LVGGTKKKISRLELQLIMLINDNDNLVNLFPIRQSQSLGLSADHYCLAVRDVDECALGLHNCSSYAICTNLPDGYSCQCPAGWEDGNPELPVPKPRFSDSQSI